MTVPQPQAEDPLVARVRKLAAMQRRSKYAEDETTEQPELTEEPKK